MVNYKQRTDTKFSPKMSLSYEPQPAWGFRASVGQAYRFPTVSELFQPLQNGDGGAARLVESNPNLKPEEVIAAELTAERRFDEGLVRISLFNEEKYDALIAQTLTSGTAIPFDKGVCDRNAGCSFIQNINHIRTTGIEVATDWQNAFVHGLDLMGSLTLSDAEIIRNKAAPETEGNQSLRIPRSMIKMIATYHHGDKLTYSVAARYSGRQFGSLNNDDKNADTFGGVSKFFVVDVKANYKFAQYWTASAGIDNLNNEKAYVFHPYPQRTAYFQLKFGY
jgi:iron complex outermembrane receptor protein